MGYSPADHITDICQIIAHYENDKSDGRQHVESIVRSREVTGLNCYIPFKALLPTKDEIFCPRE